MTGAILPSRLRGESWTQSLAIAGATPPAISQTSLVSKILVSAASQKRANTRLLTQSCGPRAARLEATRPIRWAAHFVYCYLDKFGVLLPRFPSDNLGQFVKNLVRRKTASAAEIDRDACFYVFLDFGEGDEDSLATIRAIEISALGHGSNGRPIPADRMAQSPNNSSVVMDGLFQAIREVLF